MKLVLVTIPCSKASIIPRFTPGDWPKSSALTTRILDCADSEAQSRSVMLCEPQIREQPARDLDAVEVLLGESAGGLAVHPVVAVDFLDCGGRLLDGRDAEEPPAYRDDVAE